jgi:hypothetical protein
MQAIAALMVLLAGGLAAAAEIAEIPFVPMSPEVMGKGGSFIADAHGYDSFFYNPAGFSRSNGSFTIAAATAWVYARPDALLTLGQQFLAGTGDTSSMLGFLNSQVTTGGVGAGASMGIGYAGNGLGLGLVIIADSTLYGPTLLGVSGDVTATVGFIGGLSVPFELLGIPIHFGGDVRPMIRIHALVPNSVALGMLSAITAGGDIMAALGSANALYGVGIGLDLGVIAELGWFTVGLSIRDLAGTSFKYESNPFGTLVSTFSSQMKFPSSSTTPTDQYVIPMDIAFGAAFHPDLGGIGRIVDPALSLDLHDLVGLIGGSRTLWTALHAGAEVKLLSLFTLRGGLNQGYLTVGAGVKLLILDLNLALFTREIGAHIGDRASSGATLDVALRW